MNRGVNFGIAADRIAQAMEDAFDHLVSQPVKLELPEALKNLEQKRKLEDKEAK